MKNAILLMLLAMSTTTLLAQNTPGTNQNQNNNNQQQSSFGARCEDQLANKKALSEASNKVINPVDFKSASSCEQLALVAKIQGDELGSSELRPTADGKIVCRKTGGYTADYASCKKVSLLYDSVLIAETAMFAAQKLSVEQNNAKANQVLAQKIKEGDGQNAAIDATIARNELNAKMYKTQAIAYSSVVLALAGSVSAWKGKNAFLKDCNNTKNVEEAATFADKNKIGFTAANCQELLKSKTGSGEVFANDNAKAQFITAVGSFIAKAAEAKKRAGISEFVADRLEKAKIPTDEEDLMLDPCVVNAAAPECKNKGSQGNISSGTFQGNTVDFGAGASNGFDFSAGNGVGDIAADAPAGPTDSVADVISPFEDQAKIANGILDPAAAASSVAGSGSSPAGGGGGGGGGGGSASLGDDLAGATADGNKDPDITTNKLSGKYKGGKAGGFQAVTKSKEEANPFASLFDSKSEGGGIEEDRSIASDSGEGSGLFQKISKKYGQIQQEKRLDNQTLE